MRAAQIRFQPREVIKTGTCLYRGISRVITTMSILELPITLTKSFLNIQRRFIGLLEILKMQPVEMVTIGFLGTNLIMF